MSWGSQWGWNLWPIQKNFGTITLWLLNQWVACQPLLMEPLPVVLQGVWSHLLPILLHHGHFVGAIPKLGNCHPYLYQVNGGRNWGWGNHPQHIWVETLQSLAPLSSLGHPALKIDSSEVPLMSGKGWYNWSVSLSSNMITTSSGLYQWEHSL